jgi:hypothetical protein
VTGICQCVAASMAQHVGMDLEASRSAENRLKEAGYLVHFEEFEFPLFKERMAPVLLVSFPDGRQEPAPAAAFRTLTDSGSSNVTARLRAVDRGVAEGPPQGHSAQTGFSNRPWPGALSGKTRFQFELI